jgi:hypothetical protein
MLLVTVFLPITHVYSMKVEYLYQIELPVLAKTSEAKEQAVKDGLFQVLVKITGDAEVDKNPVIRTGLKRADYYVHEYTYLSETPDASHYLLRIVYEPKDVKRLLSSANVTYWGDNRPLILVWLAAANKQRSLDIVSKESVSDVYMKMNQYSNKYALPLIFPVMDVEEMNQISLKDVTEVAMNTLTAAAKRYGPDAMLIGEMIESQEGVESKWVFVMNDFQWDWESNNKTKDEALAAIMSQLNRVLVGEFSVKNKNDS